jgi:uncharacterized membrane protein
MESSLCSDHVSFNSYPNLIISLKNKNILHSMILHIKTHNYNMLKGWVLIPLIFKIHYKTIFYAFTSKYKSQSQKDKTLLLQTDLSRSNTIESK